MSMLMKSGAIGKLKLKNRIIMAPMGITTTGEFNEDMAAFFIERAKGGASMIMLNIMVSDAFEDTSHSIFLTEENVHILKKICDESHQYGCTVCAQLMPGCGRVGGPSGPFGVPISASEVPWLHLPEMNCHEMTLDEIQTLESDFRRSTRFALDAGVDAVEIHAYGGYLTDQFLTSAWNKRTDRYGGDLDGRMTFLKELMAIVKEEGGKDFPLLVKYCPDHCVEEGDGFRKIDEGIALSKKLVECGADALHVDAGCYEVWHAAMPPIYYQEAVRQLRSAKVVKKNVSVPVLTHGRLSNVDKAEAALNFGNCDFVVIGRGLLADPQLPNKVRENRPEDILPCISCNDGCIGRVFMGQNAACVVNPFCGYESKRKIETAETPLKILVVGGGPGGCSAALYAKQAGHEVEVWEKAGRLGGKAWAAAMPYMKRDMESLSEYYRVQLVKMGIPVKCCMEATHENVADFAPDRIIWAAGGAPMMSSCIPGLDQDFVYPAVEALENLVDVGQRVVVVGGGLVGVETALHYDKMGKDVTVIEMQPKLLPEPPFAMNEQLLKHMVASSRLKCHTESKLIAVEDGCVVIESPEGQLRIACDTVLIALGYLPSVKIAETYKDICPVFTIGDSNKARNIMDATEEALAVVNSL